jgi:parallel beta-helix repeat protein
MTGILSIGARRVLMPLVALIALLAAALVGAPHAAAATVAVTAVEDSYVDASLPTTNFGTKLYVKADNDPIQIAYLKFDVPSGTDLSQGAHLRVFAESSHSRGVAARAVADSSWTETGLIYNNRPALGASAGASGPFTAGTWVEFNVSSAVTATGPVTIALEGTSTTSLKLTSSEGVNKPELVIGGTTTPPPGGGNGTFVISPVAGGPYQAVSGTIIYTGALKSVGERAVAELLRSSGGGTVQFSSGTFDFGAEYFKFENIHDIDFVGAGIDQTIIRNSNNSASDTEPFNFSGTDRVKIREMTVIAGGTARTTSDALDFDKGNNSLVENVKISGSRARAIVFDGKNKDWTANGNTVRGCIIQNVPGSGIEFLASSNNTVSGCTITGTGRFGIDIKLSSSTADQPNKKSSNNTITGNTIDQAGQDGVYVNTGDDNRITDNLITNSSDDVTGRSGIRISSSVSGLGCDDNVVSGNTATDNQATKTQTYGLYIASSLCNRTVVGPGNDFAGNRVASIRNLGTNTIFN